MKFLVLGNLSNPQERPDGQRIKSRQFLAALRRHSGLDVVALDYSQHRFFLFLQMWCHLGRVDRVFVLPGQRFLLVGAVFFRIYRVFARRVPLFHLVAVGGWISRVSDNRIYRWAIKVFDSISPETTEIVNNLRGFPGKIVVLPNFRAHSPEQFHKKLSAVKELKLVFVSRVTRSKGVFEAIELAQSLYGKSFPVSLDIFGPVLFETGSDNATFARCLAECREYVRYLGLVKPENVISTLTDYDCLIFPSTYSGEGFPGVIVESLLAGVPVIARNHMFLAQLNMNHDFGFVTGANFVDEAGTFLTGKHHVKWKENWHSQNRRSELKEIFGYPVFCKWLGEIVEVTARCSGRVPPRFLGGTGHP